jgi:hypothetical protein
MSILLIRPLERLLTGVPRETDATVAVSAKLLHCILDELKDARAAMAGNPTLPSDAPVRELVRRLYVELFHVNQQLTSIPDDEGEPAYFTGSTVRDVLDDANAFLEAAPAGVPAGFVLVPIEPTQQMCQEGQWKAQEWSRFPLRIVPIWQAMLAAAPKPITSQEVEP